MAALEALLVRLCATLCAPPQHEAALAASIAHLQLQYFAGCGQLTVLGAGPLAAQLRALMPDVPRRDLTAEHALARRAGLLFPEGLPAHDRLTDLYVVDLRGQSGAAAAALLDAVPMDSRTPVIAVASGPTPQSAADGAAAALWARELVNAVVLVADGAEASRVGAFSYQPFSRCRAAPTALQLGVWVAGRWVGQGEGGGEALFPRNERLRVGRCELVFDAVEAPVAILMNRRKPRGGWLGLRPVAAPPPGACQCAGARAPQPASGWFTGVCIEMLIEVSRHAGAQVPFCVQSPCDSRAWGTIFQNGTALGMFADLQAGRATAAAANFLTQEARYHGADLVATGHFNGGVYVVPAGMGQAAHPLHELMRPFPLHVWVSVALAAAGSSAVVWLLASRPRPRGPRRRGPISRLDHAVGFTLCTLIGVPCAADRVPRYVPLRLFLLLWFTFAFIVSAAFLANAKGHVFMSMRVTEIDTVEGILESNLDIVMAPTYAEEMLLASENDTVAAEFYRRTTFSLDVMNTIIKLVAHERRAATLVQVSAADHYFKLKAENGWRADIHLLPVKDWTPNLVTSWFALRKGSALTPVFKRLYNRMLAAGLIEYWNSRFSPSEPIRKNNKLSLGLKNLLATWNLLALGYIFALLAFLGELTMSRVTHHRAKRRLWGHRFIL